ncbi:MAG: glycosyltransferase, partial [Lachnospiraceae bacterium]|nr:glycosyltransferase [Lachnospiraceae bacterium]
MRKPIVSVVIPFYNSKVFLEDSLAKVCGQTYGELEIIYVDDGSTDNGFKVIEEKMITDPRIRLIRQERSYAGIARNTGLQEVTGEYVAFWDADDYFEPDCIEKLLETILKYDADIAIC